MTIDCHTHAYPPEVVSAPRKWAMAMDEPHWAELVDPLDRGSIQGWSDPAGMLAAMDVAGVDQAVLLGWYWENASTCRWHNAVMAKWIAHAPGRFIGFAAVHPEGSVREQLEAARELGFSGVGELHLGVQGWDPRSDAWQVLAGWCVRNKWPVNFHVTEAAGTIQPGAVNTPLPWFMQIAEQAPDLKMILAHWGGGLPFFEQNPKLRPCLRNVCYDTAASPLLYDHTVFRRVVDLVGAERVLFGSDYPLRLYPRKQKRPDMERFVQAIRRNAGLSTEECRLIMGANFAALLEAE